MSKRYKCTACGTIHASGEIKLVNTIPVCPDTSCAAACVPHTVEDQGNDSLGIGNPDKEVCKHCQEVIISFNAGADDFDYADVAEAIDQHVCNQRKHDDAEIDKTSDAYEAKITAEAEDACDCCNGTGICTDIGGEEGSCMTCCGSGKGRVPRVSGDPSVVGGKDLPFKHESSEKAHEIGG